MHGRERRLLTAGFWIVLLFLGVVQAWHTRHRIFSDGVSYLDIAGYYSQGEWQKALNAYWSPLYSFIIAVFFAVLHPAEYWQVAILHLVNFLGFIAALVAFEFFLRELISFQRQNSQRVSSGENREPLLSERTMRVVGYSLLVPACFVLIGMGYCSPDMIAMAIGFYLAYLLLRIEKGLATWKTMISFGVVLGLGYLARAAFVPVVFIDFVVAAVLFWKRSVSPVKPLAFASLSAAMVAMPFVIALSIENHHFTYGEAGKLNYAWEVNGAARTQNWQGEPYDIGTPVHPTKKVLTKPATYIYTGPVAGSYPPWYEPAYWYQGVSPHLKPKLQLRVLGQSLVLLAYLFVNSPVTIPFLAFVFLMGLRQWFSKEGILRYWFLLVPTLAYIGLYCLVYLDRRYIAGSLVISWICLGASFWVPRGPLVRPLNVTVQVISILFVLFIVATRLRVPITTTASDLLHRHEDEWNLQWVLAERFREIGLRPGDQVAYIGEGIDADWARLDHLRIIGEVPVIWERLNNLNHGIEFNRTEINAFWNADSETRNRVLDAFRKAGATYVIADDPTKGADRTGWTSVLPAGTPHLPWSAGQVPAQSQLLYRRL